MAKFRPGRLIAAASICALALTGAVALPASAAPTATSDDLLTSQGSPLAKVKLTRFNNGPDATRQLYSSVAVGDVNGDKKPEIVSATYDGFLRVWNTSGKQLASVSLGNYAITGSPALKDVNKDGVLDVVAGNINNQIFAYSFKNNRPSKILSFKEKNMDPKTVAGVFGTPAVADINGDGRQELIFSSWGQTISSVSSKTKKDSGGFPQKLYDTSWSSPAVGDIDRDGKNEVVLGGDCSGVPGQPCVGKGYSGYVWAFKNNGKIKWRTFIPQTPIWSSPALIDLNGDKALDVVIGTGSFTGPIGASKKLYALNGKTGKIMWTASTPGQQMGSPSVAMVNGQPRVFAVSRGGAITSYNKSGKKVWSKCISPGDKCISGDYTDQSPAIADIDNDGRLEVVVGGQIRLYAFDAATGATKDVLKPANSGATAWPPANSPTIAEIDGKTWIFQPVLTNTSHASKPGVGSTWELLAWTADNKLGAAPWPTFQGNMARTGTVSK